MKIIKKVLKIIVDVLTFLIFLVLILIIISKVKMMITGKDYFNVFGYSIFSVATGSMEPAINQNDVIIVKRADNYEIDDIITFRSENAYITHRIISKRDDVIVTKGDANNTKDVAINGDVIVGKVIKVYRNGGVWQKVFTSPRIIIMVFVTLMLFDFAFSYKGIQKKQQIKLVDKIKSMNINLKQVNKEAKKEEDSPKMTNKEIVELCKKTDMVQKGEDVKFDKKEKDFLNYTVRLDLKELQKRIDDKVNKE